VFVKRFTARDMQDAMKKIKKEFGPDAVILDSKTVRGKGISGLFKKNFEVVAAYEPRRTFEPAPEKTETPPKAPAAQGPVQTKVAQAIDAPETDVKIAPLEAQIESLRGLVTDISNRIGAVSKDDTAPLPSEVQGLYMQMLDRDVNQDIAKEIALLTHGVSLKQSVEPSSIARQLVIDKLGEPAPIKMKKYAQTVLLFAGPTGAGKTTTLVKLAGRLALDQNLSIGLVNMDTYRVGAMEHMRIYAEIMDIPVKTAYNAKDLKEAVDEMADRDVILIDTAGRSATDAAYRKELEEYITAAHVDEVYLVISVVTGNKVCKDIIRNYAFIPNYKLIITKLDEVGVWGNILNITDYAKKSLSYITMGQDVPDDISQVNPAMLAENIVGRREVAL